MHFLKNSQRIKNARRALMLPHRHGETEAVRTALDECETAFVGLRRDLLDTRATGWVENIERTMKAFSINQEFGDAEGLSFEENEELASSIDHLAEWFDMVRHW